MPEIPFSVRAAARLHTDVLLRHPNVVAVGAGIRRKGGKSTGEPAVVVYVSRKLPRAQLLPGELIPRRLFADEEEVGTDVIQAGEPHFVAVDTKQYRPVRGGCQIANAYGGAGTAGAVMYDRRDQRLVLLTNNHVLTNTGDPTFLPGDTRIFQPAGGGLIGASKRVVPMFRAPLGATDHNWFAAVDAGIVSLNSNIPAEFNVVEINGQHPFVALPPYEGLDVVRRGYRTQLRNGTVEAVDMTVIVTDSNKARYKVGGADCVFSIRSREREISAMPGDSGSLVVDSGGGAARGLVFASDSQSGGLTWACELGTVMTMLELDTPCTGALNALIRRAVYRRLADPWALAESVLVAGGSNALVARQAEIVDTLRHGHLGRDVEGSAGQAVDAALHRIAPALATAITTDEDAAGLLERAFGEWLVQPSVFDMLEYRFEEQSLFAMTAAFERLERLGADPHDLEVLSGIFRRAGERSMRELMAV